MINLLAGVVASSGKTFNVPTQETFHITLDNWPILYNGVVRGYQSGVEGEAGRGSITPEKMGTVPVKSIYISSRYSAPVGGSPWCTAYVGFEEVSHPPPSNTIRVQMEGNPGWFQFTNQPGAPWFFQSASEQNPPGGPITNLHSQWATKGDVKRVVIEWVS